MIEYCAGFFFDPGMTRVWLIRKNRPQWQAGRLNAIGGKLEPTEAFHVYAQRREFREETGLDVIEDRWRQVCSVIGYANAHRVVFFCAVAQDEIEFRRPRALTDERIATHAVASLWRRGDLVGNLRTELALALAKGLRPGIELHERGSQDYRQVARTAA